MKEYTKILQQYLKKLSKTEKESLTTISMKIPKNKNHFNYTGKIWKCCVENGKVVCKMRKPDEC